MHTLKKSVTVYKKAQKSAKNYRAVLITLRLPKGTMVNAPLRYSGKNRASRAVVKSIEYFTSTRAIIKGCECPSCEAARKDKRLPTRFVSSAVSLHDTSFKYRVGKTVTPSFFNSSDTTCTGGIHFFSSKERAKAY
jgi:hypothetical protein